MAHGADFSAYVVARWPAVVRALVLLGRDPVAADAAAADALARCSAGWRAAVRDGDVDTRVWHEVLDRLGAAAPLPTQPPAVGGPALPDAAEREVALSSTIGTLATRPPGDRAALALSLGAGLDPMAAADLAGVPAPPLPPGVDEERTAWALGVVPLRADPLAAVRDRLRVRRRRRVAVGLGALVALALTAALVTWLAARPGEERLAQPPVREAANPADVAWYADGVLHLPEVEVSLPQIRRMTEVPDGVVYLDVADRVVLVDAQGRLTLLGRAEPGSAIAGAAGSGWVAWVDVTDGRDLVVLDTRSGRELGRRPAEQDLSVVALDRARLYYDVAGSPWSWEVLDADPEPETGGRLVDVASAVRLSERSDGSVSVVQPLLDEEVTLAGSSARLSPDGDHVLTRVPGDLPGVLAVHRAGDGRPEPAHLAADEVALAAAFGEDRTITYLVSRRAHQPRAEAFVRLSETGPVVMRTCDLDLDTCRTVTRLAGARGSPVLPE